MCSNKQPANPHFQMMSKRPSLRSPEKPFIFTPTMFFNRYTTISLPHFGLLLAGLLLRVAR